MFTARYELNLSINRLRFVLIVLRMGLRSSTDGSERFALIFIIVTSLNAGGTLLVAQLVETLRYESEGRRFDSRWCH